MTVEPGQRTLPADPLASERLDLLAQLASAQMALEAAIAEISRNGGDGAALAATRLQLASVSGLMREVGSASLARLAELRSDVTATAASAITFASQVSGGVGNNLSSGSAAELAGAARASQRAVQSALEYTRSLDLQFASPEDEQAYRDREAARRAYIESQQATGTPEGDLNAAGAALGQMADAKAQGASGPEFERHINDLLETTTRLRAAIRGSGKSTQEFDDRLRGDIRRVMHEKGMADAEIDAVFATNPDPLAAVRTYLRDDNDLQGLRNSLRAASENRVATGHQAVVAVMTPSITGTFDDVLSALKSAGVQGGADTITADEVHHGVGMNARTMHTEITRGGS